MPYQCSASSPGDTLTEFCGSTLSFPVQIDGTLYEAVLNYRPDLPELTFQVDRNRLKLLTENGGNRATFSSSNNVVVIPDVRIGADVYQDVRLRMLDAEALVFEVSSYTRR